jgi:hypothetical protein
MSPAISIFPEGKEERKKMRADVIAPSFVDLGSQGAGTVTPDLTKGLYFRVTLTAATLTIAAPISGVHGPWSGSGADIANAPALEVGTVLLVEVKNASGSTVTVTWNALFKGAPANPANTNRRIHMFVWDGSNFVLCNNAADVAN